MLLLASWHTVKSQDSNFVYHVLALPVYHVTLYMQYGPTNAHIESIQHAQTRSFLASLEMTVCEIWERAKCPGADADLLREGNLEAK